MQAKIFYSWQSDIRAAACRTLIESALQAAVDEIVTDAAVGVEPVIDRDTQGVAGAPDIGTTIFGKIDTAVAFVADVTIVNHSVGGRLTPNPNVLVELGYALKSLGDARIILVQNTFCGGPEKLPFDLRQRRVLQYSSDPDVEDRANERRRLQAQLREAIGHILRLPGTGQNRGVDLTVDYHKISTQPEVHEYGLDVVLKNVGRRRLDDWQIEIEFPPQLIEPGSIGMIVPERSTDKRSFFRTSIRKTLNPGDQYRAGFNYRVDERIYEQRQDLFDEVVTARALVDGEIVVEVRRAVRELQCF